MAGGRPTDYTPEILEKARAYRDNPLPEDEVVHSIEGLAQYTGLARSTIYDWISQESKAEFSDITEDILQKQAQKLVNNGLIGKFTPTITKVMMSKHGYREAIDTDITTKGKEINTQDPKTLALGNKYEEELKKGI